MLFPVTLGEASLTPQSCFGTAASSRSLEGTWSGGAAAGRSTRGLRGAAGGRACVGNLPSAPSTALLAGYGARTHSCGSGGDGDRAASPSSAGHNWENSPVPSHAGPQASHLPSRCLTPPAPGEPGHPGRRRRGKKKQTGGGKSQNWGGKPKTGGGGNPKCRGKSQTGEKKIPNWGGEIQNWWGKPQMQGKNCKLGGKKPKLGGKNTKCWKKTPNCEKIA